MRGATRYLPLLVFLACLPFPALYIGELRWPVSSFNLLANGLIGVLYGYVSWLANPIFLFAFFMSGRNPKGAFAAAFIALVLALAFLLVGEIVTNARPTYEEVVAYGIGYFLWIASFLLLMAQTGTMLLNKGSESTAPSDWTAATFSIGVLLLPITIFVYHHYFSDQNQHEFDSKFHTRWQTTCDDLPKTHLAKVGPIRNIYFPWQWHVNFQAMWRSEGYSVDQRTLRPLIKSGTIDYFEYHGFTDEIYRVDTAEGEKTSIESPTSEWTALEVDRTSEQQSEFNITSRSIEIVTRSDERLAARTSYAYYTRGGRFEFCSSDRQSVFSSITFVALAIKELNGSSFVKQNN